MVGSAANIFMMCVVCVWYFHGRPVIRYDPFSDLPGTFNLDLLISTLFVWRFFDPILAPHVVSSLRAAFHSCGPFLIQRLSIFTTAYYFVVPCVRSSLSFFRASIAATKEERPAPRGSLDLFFFYFCCLSGLVYIIG